MKIINDSSIIEKHSNNCKEQFFLIENNGNLFNIHIESYDFQSLYKDLL